MTHRLPTPGSDDGSWGAILNDFLSQSHAADGTLDTGVVGPSQLQSSAVASSHLQDGAVTATKLVDGTITATKLAGNIPSTKLDAATQTQLSNVGVIPDGSITDVKISGSAAIAKSKLASSVQTSLSTADSSVQQVNGKSPTSGAVSLTATDVSAVPTTRQVNGKALSSDVTLAASDVGAITQATADGRYVAGVKQTSAPSSPSTNDLWYDSTNDVWKRWNGTAWISEGAGVYAPKPASGVDGKVVKWNNTSGQLEDATTSLNGTFVAAAAALLGWAYGQNFRLVSASRDSYGAITTASVIWPDGGTGTFTTDTASTAFPGAIDAYHVTYVVSGVTKTVTQTAVTRDATTGAVTAQPALTVA
jgi:hypothetical protein